MKKVVLLFVLALSVVSSGLSNDLTPLNDTVPSPGYVIEKALEALKGIHTVSYNLEMREYLTPEDSAFVNKSTFRYIECENKGDSTGLSKFICFNKDGEFRDSYDGVFSLRLGNGYISKTDISRQSVVSISSPFYNYVTRLCEYLQDSDSTKEVSVEEKGEYLELKAEIIGKEVIFFGNAREIPTAGGWSRFTVRFDKEDFCPKVLSWCTIHYDGKREMEVSEVKINDFGTESFSTESYLPDLPILADNGSERIKYERRSILESKEAGMNCVLPTDTLNLIGGGYYSLGSPKGKVRVLMLTLLHCGACVKSYPIFNDLFKKYSTSSEVDVKGVLFNYSGEIKAYESFLKKYNIEFPVALNNGRFYSVFSKIGLAPIFIVIDRDDRIVLYKMGYDTNLYNIIEDGIKGCLNAVSS